MINKKEFSNCLLLGLILIASTQSLNAQNINSNDFLSKKLPSISSGGWGGFTSPGSVDDFVNGYTFSYATSGSPWNGSLLSFGGFGNQYDTQINSDYGPNGGNRMSFRSRNGDIGKWNNWNEIWHSGNLNNVSTDFNARSIFTSGNVGIGTSSPENSESWEKVLEVKGNNHAKIISSSSTVQTGVFSHDSGYYGAPVGGIVGTTTNNPFSIMTNKSTKLTVATNGDIGIGTTNPENSEGWAKVLEVKGSTDSKIISSSSSVQTGIFSHNFGFYGAPVGGIVGTTTNNPFSIMTNKSTKLTVATNGNVGIGTTNPDEKLTVNGNIHAKEVRVDLKIPPDYVFDHYYSGVSKLKPSYKMPSLLEVEEFVKQNHHLPEIPSAQEIVENGLRLAQMNGLLLQKVEELTLYAIEQEKKQKSLEQELAELKTQVKAILKQK